MQINETADIVSISSNVTFYWLNFFCSYRKYDYTSDGFVRDISHFYMYNET